MVDGIKKKRRNKTDEYREVAIKHAIIQSTISLIQKKRKEIPSQKLNSDSINSFFAAAAAYMLLMLSIVITAVYNKKWED